MLESANRTAKAAFHAFFYIDEDDPKKDQYPPSGMLPGGGTLTRFDGPSVRSAKALYFLIEQVKTPFVMNTADDIEFVTQHWDKHLLKSMPEDQMAIISPYTSFKNSDGHSIYSMKWHRLIELFPKEAFEHFGPDGWALDVAKRAGRFIQKTDIIVDHHHFKNGKAEKDDTYERARNHGDSSKAQNYLDSHVAEREACVKKVHEEIARFAAEKAGVDMTTWAAK